MNQYINNVWKGKRNVKFKAYSSSCNSWDLRFYPELLICKTWEEKPQGSANWVSNLCSQINLAARTGLLNTNQTFSSKHSLAVRREGKVFVNGVELNEVMASAPA